MLAFSQVEDDMRFRHGGFVCGGKVHATRVPPPATAQRERKHDHDNQQHNLGDLLPDLSRPIHQQHPETCKAIEQREIHRPRLLDDPRPKTSAGKPRTLVSEADRERLAQAAKSPLVFAQHILGFQPDEHQARVLERATNFRQIGLNCSRQWGKSTVAAVLAVWRLITQPNSTILIIGPSGRQSGETLKKVREFLSRLNLHTRGDGVNRNSIVLANASRIVGLPAKEDTVRGFSAVSLLIVDEASRVPDEVYLALRPSLAVSHGDIILLSTPRGRRGFFYREMTSEDAQQQWFRHTGAVTECKRIPEEFLAKERSRGEAYYKQEYLCEFVESGRYLFDEALVNGMEKADLDAWRWLS